MANEDDLAEEIRRIIQARFPDGLTVPLGVSDDEAVRAVQDQFRDAGLDCSDEAAREIVSHALEPETFSTTNVDVGFADGRGQIEGP